jgi:hypothetical protein
MSPTRDDWLTIRFEAGRTDARPVRSTREHSPALLRVHLGPDEAWVLLYQLLGQLSAGPTAGLDRVLTVELQGAAELHGRRLAAPERAPQPG